MTKRVVNSPLIAARSSGWLKKEGIDNETGKVLQKYLKRFVCEAECFESSKLTGGFITDFKIDRTERASSFMTKMMLDKGSSLRFRALDSSGKLAAALEDDGFNTDSFFELRSEFVYISFSGSAPLKRSLESLREFKRGAGTKEGRRKQNKAVFYRLDCVLRHLRNSFAHGQFRVTASIGEESYWALQDSNSRGFVTSRMLLKQSTLDAWMALFYQRDIRYRNKVG